MDTTPDPDDEQRPQLDYYSFDDLLGMGIDTSMMPPTDLTGHDGRPVWSREQIEDFLRGKP
jgi:hypothetical protein